MKPRICFVGPQNLPVLAREYNSHGIGGEQVQQTLLAKALARRHYQVAMVLADYGQPDGAKWDDVETFKAYPLAGGIPGLRIIYPKWTALWAALRRARADIYYISSAKWLVGELALFCHFHHRKFIFRVAHDGDCDPTDRERLRLARDRALYQYGLRRADHVLVQTEQQKIALSKNYRLNGTIARMLVDCPDRTLSFSERSRSALWVNNLRQFKRPELYVELAKQLPDVEMHMLGGALPAFEALFSDIETAARAVPNLHFHGRVPYHDVNTAYQRSRVLVNTSDYEGFPNSYLQAWIRGTPVVTFFDPDFVIAREGLGIAARTFDEMRTAVASLTSDRQAWTAISERCRRYMATNYDEETILAPYIETFSQLAGD